MEQENALLTTQIRLQRQRAFFISPSNAHINFIRRNPDFCIILCKYTQYYRTSFVHIILYIRKKGGEAYHRLQPVVENDERQGGYAVSPAEIRHRQ